MHRLVETARQVTTLLGQGEKAPQPCEQAMQTEIRRSIVAATDLPAGTVLTAEHLTWVRHMNFFEKIEWNPRVCNGKPVIKGTRIPLAMLQEQIAHGVSWEELIRDYPEVTDQD